MGKVAVVLSGCGVFDGSEIHEAVLTLLAISDAGHQYQCFAPDIPQRQVINHLSGEPCDEQRNVLIEAARIARGEIKPLTACQTEEFDALIFPGGFGAAKNLCSFAFDGASMSIEPEVERVAKAFAADKKPVGYLCIAPAMIPNIHGEGVQCTIGTDTETAAALNMMGADHVSCGVDAIVCDDGAQVISTPAYMLAQNISEANSGIRKLVAEVLSRVK